MIVDSSALIAIFLNEPEGPLFTDLIDEAQKAIASVISHVETMAVLCSQRLQADLRRVETFIESLHLEWHSVSLEQRHLALHGLMTFGKGRHPAKLNLGDCFSYALAKSLDLPLLFKGDDFSQTDIAAVWRPASTPVLEKPA